MGLPGFRLSWGLGSCLDILHTEYIHPSRHGGVSTGIAWSVRLHFSGSALPFEFHRVDTVAMLDSPCTSMVIHGKCEIGIHGSGNCGGSRQINRKETTPRS